MTRGQWMTNAANGFNPVPLSSNLRSGTPSAIMSRFNQAWKGLARSRGSRMPRRFLQTTAARVPEFAFAFE
jgi:hypothetical protein